jgi:hypothetical protein
MVVDLGILVLAIVVILAARMVLVVARTRGEKAASVLTPVLCEMDRLIQQAQENYISGEMDLDRFEDRVWEVLHRPSGQEGPLVDRPPNECSPSLLMTLGRRRLSTNPEGCGLAS